MSDNYGHEMEPLNADMFDPDWYSSKYQDVALSGLAPAEHFLRIGKRLGRPGASRAFVNNVDGCETARVPLPSKTDAYSWVGPLIDSSWYRDKYLDRNCDISPQKHYEEIGAALGYDPNPYFNVKWYLTKYPDVAAAGVNPVEHYFRFGAAEGRNPSPDFNTRFYAMQMDKSDSLSGDLFVHFLKCGRKEGKLPDVSAIRGELSDDALGAHLTIQPVNVTIGIVAYKQDNHEIVDLIRSIDKAIASCGQNVSASIVIYDNGLTIPNSLIPRQVELRSNGQNNGFGRAHNEIMEDAFSSGSDVYIGVNPDGALHHDCLKNMIRMSQRHDGNALIEAIQFPEEHPKFYHPETLECDWISGACFLVPKKIWDDTRGFDENIFLYCEDVDLSWSARRCGYKTLTCPSALFYHDVSDRGYSERIWREMLVAGRYLAHKWQSASFVKRMEDELLSAGFFRTKKQMPKLNESNVLKVGTNVANFEKMFSFTKTRW